MVVTAGEVLVVSVGNIVVVVVVVPMLTVSFLLKVCSVSSGVCTGAGDDSSCPVVVGTRGTGICTGRM